MQTGKATRTSPYYMISGMPAPKALLSRLMAFDRNQGLLRRGDRVLAAVSGGPDSVCLLHHLARLRPHRRLEVTALHLNHGLRSQADGDQRSVERLARKLNVPLLIKSIPVAQTAKQQRRSLEDAARRLRYEAFATCAKRLDCTAVATGHQLDDQAETLLLHMLRGTKVKGLGGIPPQRRLREGNPRSKIRLIRPLLALRRAEIIQYLKAYGLKARIDATNKSERFTRNWVRKKVIPLLARRNPQIREHLSAIAEDARKELNLEGN
jgi:tRNA(Ile)-lysidine synthase